MTVNFDYYLPTNVKCGEGMASQTGEILKGAFKVNKVLIVTDKGVRDAHLLEGIESSLINSDLGYEIFDEVTPNPSAEIIHKGVEFLLESKCDVVVAVGGGSSIDAAKGIAAMATNNGGILEYEGVNKLLTPCLPLVAIPTTAGTGSEGTAATVVTNKETLFKTAIISPYLFPKLAILDPNLTVNLPPSITAATGMDALTHAIESYLSKSATPISEAMALHAMKMIGENIEKAYFVGTDITSRKNMLVASLIAGFAFAQSRLGNVHAISHTLGGVFDVPHGIANATLLPFVMKFNLPACPEKMKDIAQALGKDVSNSTPYEGAVLAIEAVQKMNNSLNIPNNIKDLGVSLEKLPQLVDDSMRSGNILVNPRLTTHRDIKNIIEHAYVGNMNS